MYLNSFIFSILLSFFFSLIALLILMYLKTISQQKKTVAKEIRNVRMLNLLMEHSPDVIFSVDKYYNYLAFNNAHAETMRSVYGKKIELGRNILDYMRVNSDAEVAENDINKALKGESYSVIRSYGDENNFTRAYFEATYNPIRNDNDTIGVSVVVRDVSEQITSQENLKRSERKYKQLFHYNYLGALVISNSTIIDANDTATTLLGLELHELLGMSLEELFDLKIQVSSKGIIVKYHLKEEKVFTLRKEKVGNDKDLQEIIFIENITEKYAAEKALNEAHMQTKILIETAKSYIFSTNSQIEILSFNSKFKSLLKNRLDIDLIKGASLKEKKYQCFFERFLVHIERSFSKNEVIEAEFQFNDDLVLQSVFSPLINTQKEVYGVAVYNLDITEKRKNEIEIQNLNSSLEQKVKERTYELNQQQLKLDLALTAANIGTWSFTKAEKFTWDKKISKIFGINNISKPVLFKDFLNILDEGDQQNIVRHYQEIFTGELHHINISVKINHYLKGDQYIQIYGKSRIENGKYEVHGVCWNLTHQKTVEFELKKARNLAEESNKAKSMFLANISHEIRSPLNAIIGLSNILYRKSSSENLSEEFIEQLRYIYFNGEYLSELINNILDYSRIEADKMHIYLEEIDIRSFINLIVKIHSSSATEKDVNLFFEIDEDVPIKIVTDFTKFRQILTNLLTNAIKFTKNNTEIKIIISSNQEFLQLSVQDKGIGISEDRIEVIFDSFEQADNSVTRQYGGTGLGLAITKRLVEMLNGKIQVYSIEGEGATFIIQLPLLEMGAETSLDTHGREREVTFNVSSKVLVVEDNKMNQFMMNALFKQLSLSIEIAENGQDAVKKAIENKYDLILMDLHMPILGGIEAAEILRNKGIETPIVALTADAYWDKRFAAFSVGINNYLTKPLDRNDLTNTLKKYLVQDKSNSFKYFNPKEHKELIQEIKELATSTALSTEHKLSRLKSIRLYLQDYDTGFNKYIDYVSEVIASDIPIDVF